MSESAITSKELEEDSYWCDKIKDKGPGYRLGYVDGLNGKSPRMADPQYLRGYKAGRGDRWELDRRPVSVIRSFGSW